MSSPERSESDAIVTATVKHTAVLGLAISLMSCANVETPPCSCSAMARPADNKLVFGELRRLSPLDHGKLSLFNPRDGWFREVRDPKNGVFLYMSKKTQNAASSVKRTYGRTEPDENGIVWYEDIKPTTNGVETMRFPLTPETVKYIVTNDVLPLTLRWAALRELRWSRMSPRDHVTLFEFATRDRWPAVRYIALAWDPEPDSSTIPVLTRSLCDPAVDVAHTACAILTRVFQIKDPKSGKPLSTGLMGSGPEYMWYQIKHRQVRIVAEAMHAKVPQLVTKADLGTIRGLDMPPLAWWKHHYGDNAETMAQLMEHYRKTLEKRSGDEGQSQPLRNPEE